MTRDYLYASLIRDEEVINKILALDNEICFTNITFDDLLTLLNRNIEIKNVRRGSFITDGSLNVVIPLLIDYSLYIDNLFINDYLKGITSYFIQKIKDYYALNNEDININLITNEQYEGLTNIYIIGNREFINDIARKVAQSVCIELDY